MNLVMNGSHSVKKNNFLLLLCLLLVVPSLVNPIDESMIYYIVPLQKNNNKGISTKKKSAELKKVPTKDSTNGTSIVSSILYLSAERKISRQQSEMDSLNREVKRLSDEMEGSYQLFYNYAMILGIVVSIVALIVVIMFRSEFKKFRNSINTQLTGTKKEHENNDYAEYNLPLTILNKEDVVRIVQEQIHDFKTGITLGDQRNDDIVVPSASTFHIENQMRPSIIYARCPKADGSFEEEYLSDTKAFEHLFRIVLESSEDESGSMEIVSDSNQYQAINAPNIFLAPACEYGHLPSPTDQRIIQISRGTVRRIDRKWRVVKKIRVEFS